MLQADIAFGRQLEALAGLDGARWLAVGIAVEPACGESSSDEVYIDAIDLQSVDIGKPDSGFREVIEFADKYGALPVTRVHLRGITWRDLLGCMTSAQLNLRATGIADTELNVVARVTHDASRPIRASTR